MTRTVKTYGDFVIWPYRVDGSHMLWHGLNGLTGQMMLVTEHYIPYLLHAYDYTLFDDFFAIVHIAVLVTRI